MPWLINAAQVDKFRKSQKNVVILDASWYLPIENKQPREEFLTNHILGARFLDLSEFHDQESTLPHMLTRDEKLISERVGALGITNDHKIIFYDLNQDLHTSCRALWMFKVFGHHTNQLYILDGGFEAWKKYGGKVESGERATIAKPYEVNYQAHLIRTLLQIKTNLHHPKEEVVDVRHPVRYAGGKETRLHMRCGHIPGSFSFPYFTMFEVDGRFKPLTKIRKQLSGIGVELEAPIVTLCGSGISSAILNFVLDLCGHEKHAIYDGSWAEWGYDECYPGEANLNERPVKTSLDQEIL